MADKMEFPDYDPYSDDYDRGYEDAEQEYKSKIDKVTAEIEAQEKWLMQAGYNAYNVDIAFRAIKRVIAEK